MVKLSVWKRLSAVAREHATYSIRSFHRAKISRATSVVGDMGVDGDLAIDFLEAIEKEFADFDFSGERGNFAFDSYFRSEISQTFGASWLYLFNRKARKADRAEKLPLTLGMLEDAIARGYWETVRYTDWHDHPGD